MHTAKHRTTHLMTETMATSVESPVAIRTALTSLEQCIRVHVNEGYNNCTCTVQNAAFD